MTILQELISLRGEGRLTYSQEGFLASHFQRQESEGERKMTVTSGRKCFGLYERYDPLGSLVRTLLESPAWYNPTVRLRWKVKPLFSTRLTRKRYSSKNMLSRPYAEILSVRDIPSSRFLFQLAVSEPRTGETGYGLLPTPRAMEIVEHPMKAAERLKDRTGKKLNNLSSGAAFGLLPTPTAQEGFNSGKGEIFVTRNNTIRIRNQNGTSSRLGLEGAVKHMLYPTPTAQDFKRRGPNSKQQGLPEAAYKKMLPTPTARSYKHGSKITDGRSRRKISQGWTMELNDLAVSGLLPNPTRRDDALCNIPVMIGQHCQQNDGKTSQLNPLFVEEMMGYPLMWTTLPFLSQNGDKNP